MEELILICEDNTDIQALLEYNLRQEGFLSHCVGRGDEAVDAVRRYKPNLVLLDLMLPVLDGLEICRQLRADPATRRTPVIMVTAKVTEGDRLSGLEAGADDYISKPFSPKELIARVRAVLRRSTGSLVPEPECFEAGEIRVDHGARRVFAGSQEVFLTATEFKILKELLVHRERVVSREGLGDAAAGPGEVIAPRTIDVHMVSLRRKLGAASRLIKSVRGIGYRIGEETRISGV